MKNTPILILIFSANLMHGMQWIQHIKNAYDYFDFCILKSCVPNTTLEQFPKFDFKAAKENLVAAAKKNLTPAPNRHHFFIIKKTQDPEKYKLFLYNLNKLKA